MELGDTAIARPVSTAGPLRPAPTLVNKGADMRSQFHLKERSGQSNLVRMPMAYSFSPAELVAKAKDFASAGAFVCAQELPALFAPF